MTTNHGPNELSTLTTRVIMSKVIEINILVAFLA